MLDFIFDGAVVSGEDIPDGVLVSELEGSAAMKLWQLSSLSSEDANMDEAKSGARIEQAEISDRLDRLETCVLGYLDFCLGKRLKLTSPVGCLPEIVDAVDPGGLASPGVETPNGDPDADPDAEEADPETPPGDLEHTLACHFESGEGFTRVVEAAVVSCVEKTFKSVAVVDYDDFLVLIDQSGALSSQMKQKKSSDGYQCSNLSCPQESKTLTKCEGCNTVSYCCVGCQAKHWDNGGHKNVCLPVAMQGLVAFTQTEVRRTKNKQFISFLFFLLTFLVLVNCSTTLFHYFKVQVFSLLESVLSIFRLILVAFTSF